MHSNHPCSCLPSFWNKELRGWQRSSGAISQIPMHSACGTLRFPTSLASEVSQLIPCFMIDLHSVKVSDTDRCIRESHSHTVHSSRNGQLTEGFIKSILSLLIRSNLLVRIEENNTTNTRTETFCIIGFHFIMFGYKCALSPQSTSVTLSNEGEFDGLALLRNSAF